MRFEYSLIRNKNSNPCSKHKRHIFRVFIHQSHSYETGRIRIHFRTSPIWCRLWLGNCCPWMSNLSRYLIVLFELWPFCGIQKRSFKSEFSIRINACISAYKIKFNSKEFSFSVVQCILFTAHILKVKGKLFHFM